MKCNVCYSMESWIKQNKQRQQKKNPKPTTYNGCFWEQLTFETKSFPDLPRMFSLFFSFLSSLIFQGLSQIFILSHFPGALAHWPLPPLCRCTPLLLNSPFTLPFKHSIPDHENCFICARVCKWKLREARGPGFYAVPRQYIQEIVLLLNLEKVFEFKFHRVFFAEGKVSYSEPLAHYSEVRATWARSAWILTKPSLPQAQIPMFILQQLEAYRLLPRQVNISGQLVQSPCLNVPGARTSSAA